MKNLLQSLRVPFPRLTVFRAPLAAFLILASTLFDRAQASEKSHIPVTVQESQVPGYGDRIPEFSFSNLEGGTVTHETLRGRVAVLDFWATWCLPCREALPEIKTLAKTLDKDSVTFLSVSVDGKREAALRFLAQAGLNWPQAWDRLGTDSLRLFGVDQFPTYLVLDREGRIVARHSGWSSDRTIDELRARITYALKRPK